MLNVPISYDATALQQELALEYIFKQTQKRAF